MEVFIYEGFFVFWNCIVQYLLECFFFILDLYFYVGCYYVQEVGFMFLAYVVEQFWQEWDFSIVLDFCGVLGGKIIVFFNVFFDDCIVVANEVIKSCYVIFRENLAKWGWANVIVMYVDSECFLFFVCWFDLVVVDVFCFGEGLFCKMLDVIKEWNFENVAICESW